jgi:hypothetical protein
MYTDHQRDIDAKGIKADRMMLPPPPSVVDVPIANLQTVFVGWSIPSLVSVRKECVRAHDLRRPV